MSWFAKKIDETGFWNIKHNQHCLVKTKFCLKSAISKLCYRLMRHKQGWVDLPIYEVLVGSQPSKKASFGRSTSTRASFGSTLWVYALPFWFTTSHCRSHRNPVNPSSKLLWMKLPLLEGKTPKINWTDWQTVEASEQVQSRYLDCLFSKIVQVFL